MAQLWTAPSTWGFANTAALAGYGLVVLPFQARLLGPDAMGVWYSFLAIGSLAIMVCNGGITPTVQRFAAYLLAGASHLQANGVPPATTDQPNRAGLRAFSRSVLVLFSGLSLVGMLLLAMVGLSFIALRVHDPVLRSQAYLGWGIQIVAIGILIPAAGITAIVQGAGGMLTSQRRLLAARLAAPTIVVAALCDGWGVASLGLGTLTMALVQFTTHLAPLRILSQTTDGPDNRALDSFAAHMRAMWPTTWRFTAVTLGAWMITVSSPLILGMWVGLAESGRFGLTVQVLQLCSTVGAVWMSTAIPRLCRLRSTGARLELRRLFLQRWALGLGTGIIASCCVILAGDRILTAIGTNTTLLTGASLAVLATILVLELNHGQLCAAFLMTGNDVPFVRAALLSGTSVIVAGGMLAAYTPLGIWSIIIAQGGVQAAYNNWRWPYEAFRQIKREQV